MSSDLIMAGSYNYGLVALSILIAMLESYATIELAGRVRANKAGARLSWQIGGATAIAIGIWAMHYTGMLAFHLPVPIYYDWPTSILSFVFSLLASAIALVVVTRRKMESPLAFVASVFMGVSVAALHYTAMTSMRLQGMHDYSPALAILSVLMALVFAFLSIWLTFHFRDATHILNLRKVASVATLGTTIWTMHYTGMASASFMKSDTAPDLSHSVMISTLGAVGIGAVALMVLAVALLTATLDRVQKGKLLLDELFEQAPQGVALLSAEDRVVRVNKEFLEIFGYSPKDAVGRHLRELLVPYDLPDEVQKFIDILASKQRLEAEVVRRRKDGSRLSVSIVHVPISLPGGEVVRYAIYRDITERKQVEETLRQSEERFRQMAEGITEVFWMTNSNKNQILYLSPGYEKIWGRSRESVYEKPITWLDAVHPDDRQRVEKAAMTKQVLGTYDEEYRIIRHDGSLRWIRDRAFPVNNAEGRVYRVTGIAEDITERKLADEKFKSTSAQLRALSARLHSTREQEGIRIAREIHDELGAALSSLRWDLEDIDEPIHESVQQPDLQERRKKIKSMMQLIDTTIDTVRRISSELRPIGLDALGLVEAIRFHARQFHDRTGINVEYDSSLENARLSREQSTAVFRISQEVLTNVLRHAKATTVNIQMKEENEEFILTISDNGCGITDDQKSGQRTLGILGMRERAHLIGGRIEITGSIGKGTLVVVSVPIFIQETVRTGRPGMS